MATTISEILGSAAAIAKGMTVTLKEMMSPTVTEDYPDAPAKFQERYRGVHVLQRDEAGLEKCVACFLCAAACPANCIYIEAAENTEQTRMSGGERYARFTGRSKCSSTSARRRRHRRFRWPRRADTKRDAAIDGRGGKPTIRWAVQVATAPLERLVQVLSIEGNFMFDDSSVASRIAAIESPGEKSLRRFLSG